MTFGMDSALYWKLSALMFLEFAVWGAWYPVLAARLLGPLKFSGKQTGWIYAALPLACIFMPLLAGQMADRYVNTEYILAAAHLIGVLLLFIAAWRRTFKSLFTVILLYSLCYAATLPLVNSLMFHHLAKNGVDIGSKSPYIFMWAPIAWALAGYFLTGWRWIFKTGEQGRDCLVLAAALSVAMAVVCGGLMPETPPAGEGGNPMRDALGMLARPNFLVFFLVSMAAAGMMQFYFLGTAQFMQNNGIAAKNVPASMAIAQAVQAAATLFLLGWLVTNIGHKWTLTVGTVCWLILFLLYVIPRPPAVIVASQAFHGLAYVFFIIAGQMFVEAIAPEGTLGSMQALVFTAQSGLGLFLGTQLAGVVMDKHNVDGKFRWNKIFPVPLAIMAACALVLGVIFWPASLLKARAEVEFPVVPQEIVEPAKQPTEPNVVGQADVQRSVAIWVNT
ncbi:MFS transporter [Anaerobaca lacustris]|uniref:MFS transporter n=1 Tax=Anaerobaca lacustris TaxID=3044600 RepID=A0AAW6TZ09_9BACT|nr:MFS transporter [Sedimentisphaerales bacterium M17dextr]